MANILFLSLLITLLFLPTGFAYTVLPVVYLALVVRYGLNRRRLVISVSLLVFHIGFIFIGFLASGDLLQSVSNFGGLLFAYLFYSLPKNALWFVFRDDKDIALISALFALFLLSIYPFLDLINQGVEDRGLFNDRRKIFSVGSFFLMGMSLYLLRIARFKNIFSTIRWFLALLGAFVSSFSKLFVGYPIYYLLIYYRFFSFAIFVSFCFYLLLSDFELIRLMETDVRFEQFFSIISDLVLFGHGTGAPITNGYMRVEQNYAFELSFLAFLHKFGLIYGGGLLSIILVSVMYATDKKVEWLRLALLGAFIGSFFNPMLAHPALAMFIGAFLSIRMPISKTW